MVKEWFILVDNCKEGPFSLLELKRDYRLTPDTFVWKAGFAKWIKARDVAELNDLFKDPQDKCSDQDEEACLQSKELKRDDSVIALYYDPFQFWFWLLAGALLVIYTFSKLGWFDR